MNDIESVAFPFLNSGSIFSDVFVSPLPNDDNTMNSNDMEFHEMLDDIGFFEADDEESMLLPTSDIVQTDNTTSPDTSYGVRVSPPASAVSAPVFVSSHDLVISEEVKESPWKSIPVTVSSASVASKIAPLQPLTIPGYYLATNKFSVATNMNIPLAPIPVSPTVNGRPLIVVTGTTSAPATAALAALAAKPVTCESNNSKKRRLSDIPSESWVSEEEVEMRRYVGTEVWYKNFFFCQFFSSKLMLNVPILLLLSVSEIGCMPKRVVNARNASLIL
jgi:hypothetical protein